MKAIAIRPGVAGSIHLRDVPRPRLEDVPGGRGVRVRIIRTGLCGTDADLAAGEYGRAPEGADHLILGHESLGRVLEVGPGATGEVAPGQLVVITIRRPGDSAYDRIGRPDLSSDDIFIETGISRAHGFMTEEVVVEARYLVPVPDDLEAVAILTEPLSCITKSLRQADQVQARLGLWEPRRALVTGAGTIGLLASLALRLRGLDVTTYARRRAPYRNSQLVERIGARYSSASDADLAELTRRSGPFDIVFEGSGAPQLVEPAVAALAPNGVLALFSVTPGSHAAAGGHGPPQPGRGALQPRHRRQRRGRLGRLCRGSGDHRAGGGGGEHARLAGRAHHRSHPRLRCWRHRAAPGRQDRCHQGHRGAGRGRVDLPGRAGRLDA